MLDGDKIAFFIQASALERRFFAGARLGGGVIHPDGHRDKLLTGITKISRTGNGEDDGIIHPDGHRDKRLTRITEILRRDDGGTIHRLRGLRGFFATTTGDYPSRWPSG